MSSFFEVRFLDHTLAAVEHGQLRFYDGTIVSFQRGNDVSPRSMSDLHTLVSFQQHATNADSEDALSIIFCFHDSCDVGVVCSSAHEVNVITKLVEEAKSSVSLSGTFVHMHYASVEDVAPFVRFQGSPLLVTEAPGDRKPLPFPHTRLDFLRLSSNRSVQCKLASLNDTRIELSCDGVSAQGALCSGGADAPSSLSLRQARQVLADQQQEQLMQQQHDEHAASAKQPTKVVILSDQAIYVTENNGRVCGRIALGDITELVHMPEASALFIVGSPPHTATSSSSSVVGGSLLISRFCPDIWTRMSMSGRLVRCLPPQASVSELQHIAAVGVGMGIGGSAPQAAAASAAASSSSTATLEAILPETPQQLLRIAKEEQEIRERHEQLLLATKPTMCDFATQTGAEDHDDEGGGADRTTMSAASPSPARSIKNAAAETLYWMNQAERLQAALSRRDVALRMAHERYEALANSTQAQSKQSKQKQHHQHQESGAAMELQRELEVLRHYSRLLEEEVVEFNEGQSQQRIIELSKDLMTATKKRNDAEVDANNASSRKEHHETDDDDDDDDDADAASVEVLRTALRDSQRHQAMLTRRCDRLQSELQSVMLNTDAGLKELTGFVATIVSQHQEQRQLGGGGGIDGLDVPALVQEIVADLHNVESKVQSEAQVKVAELKALNASLVLELRSREQELERLASEMDTTSTRAGAGLCGAGNGGGSRVFTETVTQNAADAKHRSLSRNVADLQQVRDRLVEELQHIFEGANAQKQLRSLQERVNLLERMHQFPLLINRTASLEAVAAECEAAKLQARSVKQELEAKTAQLSKRSTFNTAMQADMDALKKRAATLEQQMGKETARRQEVEKKAAEAAHAHQHEVKELRKQVKYHQVRVQELLKRVNIAEEEISQQQQQQQPPQQQHRHVDPEPATTLRRAASPAATSSTTKPPSRSVSKSSTSTPKLMKLDQNVSAASARGSRLSAPSMNKTTAASAAPPKVPPSLSPARSSPPRSSPTKRPTTLVGAGAPGGLGGGGSSPEVFGVVEDPVEVARTRFATVASTRTRTPMRKY